MISIIRRVYHSCLVAVYLCGGIAGAEPMPTKNHSPVWFGLLYMTPDRASVTGAGEKSFGFQFDYSSIYVKAKDDSWDLNYDMELMQLTLDMRTGIRDGIEIGLEQPVFYSYGGFLDEIILDYHSLFGFPDYPGQRAAPRNRFLYSTNHNGSFWNVPEPTALTNGDTTLWVKKEFYNKENTTVSFKLALQVPTASTSNGFGNGAWEGAAMLLASRTIGRFETTINLSVVNPSYIDRGDKHNLKAYGIGHVSINYLLIKRLYFISQFTVAGSPYSDSSLTLHSKMWREVSFGFRYVTQSGRKFTIGFLEDLSNTAPDFTGHLSASF